MAQDESSAKAAHEIVLSIVSTWNEKALTVNSSPALQRVLTPNDVARLFKMDRRLGALQSLHGNSTASK